MPVSLKAKAKIVVKELNSSPVAKKAVLISTGKGKGYAEFPHPLGVLNKLFMVAKNKGFLGIDKNITALDLKNAMDNTVPDLSTKYESNVSFQIFYSNINGVIEETLIAINKLLKGKPNPETLVKLESKLDSLTEYDLLFDVMGFEYPCLVMLFPCVNGKVIPPSDYAAFVCEIDVCHELQLMLDAESVHTVH